MKNLEQELSKMKVNYRRLENDCMRSDPVKVDCTTAVTMKPETSKNTENMIIKTHIESLHADIGM